MNRTKQIAIIISCASVGLYLVIGGIKAIIRETTPPKSKGTVYRVAERAWKVTNGGDFNVLIDTLQERGFSNTVLQLEKNGHLFNVNIPDRTNATIIYIGKKL